MDSINEKQSSSKRMSIKLRRLLMLATAIMMALASFTACDKDDENGGENGTGKVWVDKQGGAQNVAYPDLLTAVTTITTKGNAGKYTVRIGENQQLIHNLIIGESGVEIILKANDKPVEITMNPMLPQDNFIFIFVIDGASLTLDKGITIKGKGEAVSATALLVAESELIMNDGVTISNFGREGTLEVVSIANKANFVMNGGSISNNYKRGVGVGNNSTFIMNGGVISGNVHSDEHGGAGVYVYNYAKFTMNGGTISKNNAVRGSWGGGCGGGVNVAGGSVGARFEMKGGSIVENKADDGGGVYIYGSEGNAAIFAMEDGSISANTASDGGGVFVDGYSGTSNGVFNMTGGVISKNIATNYGGGVELERYSIFTKTGKSIIYGENGEQNANIAEKNGHTAHVNANIAYRDLTAGEGVEMRWSDTGAKVGWDY